MYFVLPEMSGVERQISTLSSILLIPTESPPVLSVAWTLVHEILFYSIFLFYFINSRIFYCIIASWFTLIVVNTFYELPINPYITSILNLEFFIGMAVAKIMPHANKLSIKVCLFIATLLIALSLSIISYTSVGSFRLLLAIGLGVLIIAYIQRDPHIRWSKFYVLLGCASYSIYLVHNPLLSVSQRIFANMNDSSLFGLFFGVITTTSAGILYYFAYEKRVIHLSKNLKRKIFNE